MNMTIKQELEETAISFLKWARDTLENEPATFGTLSLVPQVTEAACNMIDLASKQGVAMEKTTHPLCCSCEEETGDLELEDGSFICYTCAHIQGELAQMQEDI